MKPLLTSIVHLTEIKNENNRNSPVDYSENLKGAASGSSEMLTAMGTGSLGMMAKNRLEYFSDTVIAIIITIMVLELKAPHGTDLDALKPLTGKILCYILSFVYLATYWTNHHHLLHAVKHVNGKVLLANAHLLFWLSLIPFLTAWLSENKISTVPAVLYGVNLFMSAMAYNLLTHALASLHGKNSIIAKAVGKDWKGKWTLLLYGIGIALTFLHPYLGFPAYIIVAGIWIIPDLRFEKLARSM